LISQYFSGARCFQVYFVIFGMVSGVSGCASVQPNDTQAVPEIYKQAVASSLRTDDDRNADAKRKPLEFLQFAEVRPGMRVLDVAAGGGYTTQLLAIVVGSNGKVWAQGARSQSALGERLANHPQSNIVPVIRPFEDPVPDGVSNLDLITIIMNYHDIAYMPVDRAKMDQRLFNALKTGGHLVVMDHSAKSGSGISAAKSLHRIDERIVIDEFLNTGFQLEEKGEFLWNPDDPRDQAFFNMTIQTDKFALRFAKP
jgi:predicted methyltransferase